MNILCVAPYHVTGTLLLWKREFARRGHRFRYVTLFRSPFGFDEDICLDLPLQPSNDAFIQARTLAYKALRGAEPDDAPIDARPPFQPAPHPAVQTFFDVRDNVLAPRINSAIEQLNLDDADIIWLDQGAEFFRDGRTVQRWAAMDKPMMAFYHGSDMRNRGILPQIDQHLGLRLTSEVDLLYLDDRLEYLFLPVDLSDPVYAGPYDSRLQVSDTDTSLHAHDPHLVDDPIGKAGSASASGHGHNPETNGTSRSGKQVRIGHAARVRSNKGSDTIIDIVTDLRLRGYPVEMVMIENLPHAEAQQLKASCDIFVDQIADAGGWGYGMSGVESLAMGIPTITRMGPEMQAFVPDHPFIHATAETLEQELIRLVDDETYRAVKGRHGREWVANTHDIRAVADKLVYYWQREGWM
ncbi:glycosyltransferase [bacterium]|nr:glycosyltransferase [bacterium]